MDVEKSKQIDALGDLMHDKFEELYVKQAFKDIQNKLNEICATLEDRYSVTFFFDLNVFDSKREKMITVFQTGLTCGGKDQSRRCQGAGSSFHTYIVDGKRVGIPHDYCPNCWAEWDFKFLHRECPGCGFALGENIQVLLDTDVCPNCEEGKVTRSNPKCDKCGQTMDPTVVHWG